MSQRQYQQTGQQGTGQFQQSAGERSAPGTGLRFETRNYLDEGVRRSTCQRLNRLLADTSALRMAATYAHWNVRGMHFLPLHELFEEIADTLADHEDLVAERIAALGGQAHGTIHQAARTTRIPPMSTETTIGAGFVEELAARMATHDANLYACLRACDEAGDLDTADMLNEISRDVTHYLWFLEAHHQGDPTSHRMGQVGGQQQQQMVRTDSQ